MTSNVELHLTKWFQMKGALGSLTGTSGTGFAKDIDRLVDLSEKAKAAIVAHDVDGIIGFSYSDDRLTANQLQAKLEKLETYSSNVQSYITEKIDRPFYEAMDKVGTSLEALNIANYTTGNIIGFKKTIPVVDGYGKIIGTQQKLVKEVGLKELYQVDNPYKKRLQAMYGSYKSSDDYKESKLTEEDYLFASHQTRAFTYHSLNDEKAAFEGKRDLVLAAGVVILSIFCPPAGAVAGVALAAADMYSAASGKDWMTGRELDDGERLMRGAFALFDLVPGVGYLNDLAKTGKVAGLAGIKASLKTSFKEGMEQAAKNVDNFKVVLKNVDDFGKRVVTKIDDFGKQLDNLVNRTVISGAEQLSTVLKNADSVISEAAQNFRLNIENIRNAFVPQFAYETVGIADDVVKNADEVSQLNRVANKIDEFVESKKSQIKFDNDFGSDSEILVQSYRELRKNKNIPGQAHHLNQNAAFRDIIPRNDGLSIKLEGNIRKDIGSPHYKAHESLEEFWDLYRKGGKYYRQRPQMVDYNLALKKSLLDAGLTIKQADEVVAQAIQQQELYGLLRDSFVPRIPRKIYLPKL